ncbi:hypothetical protein J2R96_006812 [Bradyrhizobium elkanii]|nr:hypothetical protein [Bradyrhizobium elkanii]
MPIDTRSRTSAMDGVVRAVQLPKGAFRDQRDLRRLDRQMPARRRGQAVYPRADTVRQGNQSANLRHRTDSQGRKGRRQHLDAVRAEVRLHSLRLVTSRNRFASSSAYSWA